MIGLLEEFGALVNEPILGIIEQAEFNNLFTTELWINDEDKSIKLISIKDANSQNIINFKKVDGNPEKRSAHKDTQL